MCENTSKTQTTGLLYIYIFKVNTILQLTWKLGIIQINISLFNSAEPFKSMQ